MRFASKTEEEIGHTHAFPGVISERNVSPFPKANDMPEASSRCILDAFHAWLINAIGNPSKGGRRGRGVGGVGGVGRVGIGVGGGEEEEEEVVHSGFCGQDIHCDLTNGQGRIDSSLKVLRDQYILSLSSREQNFSWSFDDNYDDENNDNDNDNDNDDDDDDDDDDDMVNTYSTSMDSVLEPADTLRESIFANIMEVLLAQGKRVSPISVSTMSPNEDNGTNK
uniref:Uncharacterized protein n=1 Tax=Vespula pensylvanica TaxID=30213 RepID=A0A834P6B6_VESPE|nr:hypothetical protein H0235_006225 [Vespula pensylvanica]